MEWLAPATVGLFAAGAGVLCYVLVANLEPQPEYPALMTDLIRLLRAGIAICGLAIGGVFLYAAAAVSRLVVARGRYDRVRPVDSVGRIGVAPVVRYPG